MEDHLDIFVDTDFAGRAQTSWSTSGGVILYHGHCVKHWSVTQSTLSLSSGASELHSISKRISAGLGTKPIIQDLGFKVRVMVHSDACTAVGMERRRVLGRMRHLDVEDLWIQARVRDGHIDLLKVKSNENTADVVTSYVTAGILSKMLLKMNLKFVESRNPIAPELPPESLSSILRREEDRKLLWPKA